MTGSHVVFLQVQFQIHYDWLEYMEEIFKSIIKDKYDGRNKFKFELSVDNVIIIPYHVFIVPMLIISYSGKY